MKEESKKPEINIASNLESADKQSTEKTETTAEKVQEKIDYTKHVEELKVSGKELVQKIKELLHESNVRRIRIKKEGKIIMEVPLSVATVGIILAPVLSAVGGLAAFLTECTIEVERVE